MSQISFHTNIKNVFILKYASLEPNFRRNHRIEMDIFLLSIKKYPTVLRIFKSGN